MIIGEKPHFLEPQQLERGKELKKQLDHLIRRRAELGSGALRARKRKAEEAYLQAPTEANLTKFKKESETCDFLLMNYKVRRNAELDLNSFLSKEAIPFVRPILERGLEVARQALASVTEVENQRCLELIGTKLTFSDIVESARRPVFFFEQMLRRIDGSTVFMPHSVLAIFEALPELVTDSSNGAAPKE